MRDTFEIVNEAFSKIAGFDDLVGGIPAAGVFGVNGFKKEKIEELTLN